MVRVHHLARSGSVVLALGAWMSACTEPSVLQGRAEGLREIARQAADRGAVNCAPQELALAEANIEFAELELDQGNTSRAQQHLVLAESNANAALKMSTPGRCTGQVAPDDRDRDGIPDDRDKCPAEPEDQDGVDDLDGCPEDQDTDGDSFGDAVDLCVAEPEDVDGYLDGDGCPDPDNDGDLVPDASDKCPLAPEDPDGFEDADGCPDEDNDLDGFPDKADLCPNEVGPESERGCPKVYKDVEVTGSHVVIKQQVHFETNRAKIRPESFGLLDTVAQVLRDYPAIQVEVQGHTDSQGPDKKNLKLSQQRADAVREYLISHGIEPYRMTATGYGEARPIESNKTASGRAANRRVEFRRTDEASRNPPAQAP
jgi:outer membrane protein OmpA-like peptidoglycan-associated protein